jgi:hypothetical protein
MFEQFLFSWFQEISCIRLCVLLNSFITVSCNMTQQNYHILAAVSPDSKMAIYCPVSQMVSVVTTPL